MIKMAALVWLVAIVVAALGLFHVKYEVQRLEEELGLEHQSILKRQEAIHILKAEWSYLNQPARISDLARRHLGLAPLVSEQVVRLDDLPQRARQQAESSTPALDAILARARSAK
jgi:cell division protein FtsL